MLADAAVETVLGADIAKLNDAPCVDICSKVSRCVGSSRVKEREEGGRAGGRKGRRERRENSVSTRCSSAVQSHSSLQ